MALDNFQAQVFNIDDDNTPDPLDPSGFRGRNAADASTTVHVFLVGTLTLASLFATSNVLGNTISNPFNTDSEGNILFYAEQGRYDVVVNYIAGRNNRGWFDVAIGEANLSNLQDTVDGITDNIGEINQELDDIPLTYPTIERANELIDEAIEGISIAAGLDPRIDIIEQINSILDSEENERNIDSETEQRRTEIARVDSTLGTANASIIEINQTIATLDSSVTSRFNVQQSSIDNNEATILQIDQTVATLDSSTTTRFANQQSTINNNQSSITTLNQTIASETSTRASQVALLNANDTAQLARLDSVETQANGNSTAISSVEGAVNNPTTGLSAAFNLANTANITANNVALRSSD